MVRRRDPIEVPTLTGQDVLFHLGVAQVTLDDVLVVVTGVVMMLALDRLVATTKLGRGIRAVAQDPEVATLMGVNLDRIILYTFLIGGLMAGVAATLYDLHYHQTQYSIGQLPGLKAFTAAVLGGIGNLRGALLGGLIIGLLEFYGSSLFGSQWRDPDGVHRPGPGAPVPSDRVARRIAGQGKGMTAPDTTPWQQFRRARRGAGDRAGRIWTAQPWWSKTLAVVALYLALAILLPTDPVARIMAPQSSWPNVLSEDIGVFILLAIGLNVVVGQAGMLDLGYVAFYAVGGYALALLATRHHWTSGSSCRSASPWRPCPG